MSTQITQIRFRQGTAAEWLEANPILADGEPGYETDTNKFKIGDGENTWSVLHYQGEGDGQGITGININGTPAAVVDGIVGLTIPTQTSELTNNSGFVTITDLDNNGYIKGADVVTTGEGAPTIETVGKLNQFYRDTVTNKLYMCTGIEEIAQEPATYSYTWTLQGEQGPAGQGVPAGGTAGQVLSKIDGTDYNTEWKTLSSVKYQHNIIFQGRCVNGGVEVGTATFSLTLINEDNNSINTLALLTSALQAIGANSFNTALQASGLSQYKESTYDSLHYINGIYSTYGTSLYGRALKYDNTNQTYSLISEQATSPILDSYTSDLLITDKVIAL